tara:strand:+ start:1670 stop:2131 length:462 start_codon:yes stop_codon:yes gene_type:complete
MLEKLKSLIPNRYIIEELSMRAIAIVILVLIAHHSSAFERVTYHFTDDIPPDCIYIIAEVVDKGRVDDGFGIHYLKIIGVAEHSNGDMVNNTRFKMYVSPITYNDYEVGSVYEELLCNSEDKEEFIAKINFILDQDWFDTWDGGEFNTGWLYR